MKRKRNVKEELKRLERIRESNLKSQKKYLENKKNICVPYDIDKFNILFEEAKRMGFASVPAMIRAHMDDIVKAAEKVED